MKSDQQSCGRLIPILYCGDVFRFYIAKNLDVCKVEKITLGEFIESVEFVDVPECVKHDLIVQVTKLAKQNAR